MQVNVGDGGGDGGAKGKRKRSLVCSLPPLVRFAGSPKDPNIACASSYAKVNRSERQSKLELSNYNIVFLGLVEQFRNNDAIMGS